MLTAVANAWGHASLQPRDVLAQSCSRIRRAISLSPANVGASPGPTSAVMA
jgi:hypothetical protein